MFGVEHICLIPHLSVPTIGTGRKRATYLIRVWFQNQLTKIEESCACTGKIDCITLICLFSVEPVLLSKTHVNNYIYLRDLNNQALIIKVEKHE